jgi:hypothetical protein
MRPWYLQLREGRLALRETALCLALLAAWLIVAPLGFWLSGGVGLVAASVAALVCAAAAAAALAVSELSRISAGPLVGLLASIGIRMGVPLLFVLAIQLHGGVLTRAGVVYYVVLFYLLALVVEVPLSIAPGHNRPGCSSTASNSV